MSQASATVCIQVPTREIIWPLKKSWKLRFFNARNMLAARPCPSAPGAGTVADGTSTVVGAESAISREIAFHCSAPPASARRAGLRVRVESHDCLYAAADQVSWLRKTGPAPPETLQTQTGPPCSLRRRFGVYCSPAGKSKGTFRSHPYRFFALYQQCLKSPEALCRLRVWEF